MKSFALVSVLATLVAQALAQLQVNSPTSLVQCEPALLSWTGGSAPYYLTVIPGGDPSGSALKSWPATDSTSVTWNVDIASGTSVTLALRDSTGTQVYSSQVTISSSSDSSCVNSNVDEGTSSGTGSTTASGSTTEVTSGTTSTGSTSSVSSTGSTTSAASSGSTTHSTTTSTRASTGSTTGTASSSATSSSSSSGAAVHGASFGAVGAAGVLGAVVAALF